MRKCALFTQSTHFANRKRYKEIVSNRIRIVFDVSSETNNEPSFEPVITLGTMFMAVIIQNITSVSTRKICYLWDEACFSVNWTRCYATSFL